MTTFVIGFIVGVIFAYVFTVVLGPEGVIKRNEEEDR